MWIVFINGNDEKIFWKNIHMVRSSPYFVVTLLSLWNEFAIFILSLNNFRRQRGVKRAWKNMDFILQIFKYGMK